MNFYEFYSKVEKLYVELSIGRMNVAVSTEDGVKIVKDIKLTTSIDGVGKFVEIVYD